VNGRINQDDLTIALKNIIKYNKQYKDRPTIEAEDALQSAVTLYYDPKHIKPIFYKNSKLANTMSGVVGRLKGKNGRLRNNLMGKRVNQCARNVITGDSHLGVCEVGVSTRFKLKLLMLRA
jgi:DNA-directed RNA polymerase II subunit RPB1